MSDNTSRGIRSAEFILVAILVLALLLAMLMIFVFVTSGTDAAAIQTNRKDMLAIILGAFGAWIGAGAAYFFGRENMRAATDAMLKMRGLTPQERLAQAALRDLKPKSLHIIFHKTDPLSKLKTFFEEDPARFFAAVVNEHGEIDNAVDEEALYRFRCEKQPDMEKETIQSLYDYIKEEAAKFKDNRTAARDMLSLISLAVVLNETRSALAANEAMEQEHKFITIVTDNKSNPTGYITTSDIRRYVLT